MTHVTIERDKLERMMTLLAVATLHTPALQAERTELVEAGLKALAAQPAVQEPVGRVCFEGDEVVWTDEPPESGTLLYTTPPAAQPAVPDAIHHTDLSEHPQYIEGWNDCRAEMLKARDAK
jgi:hypothetical protein